MGLDVDVGVARSPWGTVNPDLHAQITPTYWEGWMRAADVGMNKWENVMVSKNQKLFFFTRKYS